MSFAFPSLLWLGIPLLAATLAVHLLNLRRQKPVAWAAMDFLLESERQNRTWINLKQWLLLAVRMLAIVLAVFALARPQLEKFNLASLADSRVMHIVVLDDSYSMSDAGANTSAWPDALEAVDRVLALAAEKPGHQVTIVRTSALATSSNDAPSTTLAEDTEEIAKLRLACAGWQPSQTSGGFAQAIQRAAQLAEAAPTGMRRLAYLITDGRRRDAEPLATLQEEIESLQDAKADVRWVSCVATQSENLTITELGLLPGPQAAGVELAMSVTVANHGPTAAQGAVVQVERDGRSLPGLELGAIPSGKTATRKFAVRFREPGAHRVTAQLESDAIATDNTRYAAFDLAPERRVLLLDGSPDRREGSPFAAALRPNPRLNTGWLPELVHVTSGYEHSDFSGFAVVFLLDVPALSKSTAAALREYVSHGGGLVVGLGADVDRRFYNDLLLGQAPHAVGGFTLDKPRKPEPPPGDAQGDLTVTDHPLFKVFAGERDSFLRLVTVDYLYSVNPIAPEGGDRVLATHSDGQPLMVESNPGSGRVVFLMTSVGQSFRREESWSNLSTLPVFPVLALELAAYVAEPGMRTESLHVAEPWRTAALPSPEQRVRIGRVEAGGSAVLLAESDAAGFEALPGPQEAGYYQLELSGPARASTQTLAVNVDAREGDLRLAPGEPLAAMLTRLGVRVETAVALSAASGDGGPSPLPPLLGLIAVALLLGEQALAISASYHEPRKGGPR